MFQEYVTDLANQAGIKLSHVSLVSGQSLGCLDVYLLNISSKGHKVNTLIFQADVDNMKKGIHCDRLEIRMRTALSRLKLLLEP